MNVGDPEKHHPLVLITGALVANVLLWALLLEAFSLVSQFLDWIVRLALS